MSTVTTFGVGVTTLTDVDAISHIAQDIKDMAASIEEGNLLEARRIYEFGKWSSQYDKFGNEKDEKLSLKHMSGAGSEGMFKEDPSYMFQVLGLADVGLSIEDTIAKHGNYADVYITEQLNDFSSGTLGAQASTILIVSMYASHQLWDGVLKCQAAKDGFGAGVDKAKQAFDNFIGLYIGYGQTLAPTWDGDMLYELAQAGGDLFDTTDVEGESHVNSDIRQIYQSIQRLMSEENACSRDDHIERLWIQVNRIIARMYIPMVQMLIHSMKQNEEANKVRMYAYAVIPQLSQCRPSVHRKLKDYLLDKDYDKKDFTRILSLLQESYDCLGIACDDIGAYKEDEVAECAGYEVEHPLASFIPKKDVRSLAKVDLDILAIDQLLKFPSSTKSQLAHLYYKYGKAASIDDNDFGVEPMSLWDMISANMEGSRSPYGSEIVEYFRSNNYETLMVESVFNDEVQPKNTLEQRRAMIVSLLRYNVIPEYMMHLLGLTLEICKDTDNSESPTQYWDAFGALYIGSLEGIDAGGTEDDGLSLWGLAHNRARQFNTQDENRMAKVNKEMTDLLFAGQSELERRDCGNFEKTFSRTLHLMLVPLIQSTIWYAIRNEGALDDDVGLAIGESLALSTLPIVSKYDQKAAAVIERNMIRVDGVAPVTEGPQKVANAYFTILDDIGWGCEYIGQAGGIDACEQFDPNAVVALSAGSSAGSTLSKPAVGAIFVGVMSALWIFTS